MINEENILKSFEALGDLISRKDSEINGLKWQAKRDQEKIEEQEGIIRDLHVIVMEKDSKISDLEERIAIMAESEAPEESTDFAPLELKKEGE